MGTIAKWAGFGLLIATAIPAAEFTDDGVLSPANEELRWHMNRTRANPEAEADRLNMVNTTPGSNGQYDIAEDTTGVNNWGNGPTQWAVWKTPRQPLAPNRLISLASETHSFDLADSGFFTHDSPTANYYPLGSGPFERQAVEGYQNQVSGFIENLITASLGEFGSFPTEAMTPRGAHEALFIDSSIADRGHRKTILNDDAREIGIGYANKFFKETHSGYEFNFIQEFYTYDLGKRNEFHYFTGSIFQDANADDAYGRGEGVEGIEVRLYQAGAENAWHDVSTDSGNFAVPIETLQSGTVTVVLVNTGAESARVSIPIDHAKLGEIEIPAGASYVLGTFEKEAAARNIGFRDLTPATRLDIACQTENVSISFNAMIGLRYIVQTTSDIGSDTWITLHTLTADEYRETITCGGEGDPLAPAAIFRVLIQQTSLPPGGAL